MATRLYLYPIDTSPRFYLDPAAYHASWENTANSAGETTRLFRSKLGYALDQFTRNKTPATGDADRLMAVLVSNQLVAQTITGTAKAVARVLENASTSEIRSQIVIRVMSADIQTERGVLYAGDDGAMTNEWATSLTNRYFPQSGSAALTSVDVQDGDRLLIEIGYRSHLGTSAGSGSIQLGDGGEADLPDNQTNTASGAPWIEFSQDLIFKDYPHGETLYAEAFTGTTGANWDAEWDTASIGVDSDIDINSNEGQITVGTASTSDSGKAILDDATFNAADADVYFRFRFDSLEPVSGSGSGAVVALVWLRGDGTWNSGTNNERPDNDGLGFEWWNNRPGVKIVELFGGTIFHPSTDFECLIRPPVDTNDTWVRIRLEDSFAAMKMWQGVKADEPLDWQIESHAVQVAGTGHFQIACKRDNSNGTVVTSMMVDELDIADGQGGFTVEQSVGSVRVGTLT